MSPEAPDPIDNTAPTDGAGPSEPGRPKSDRWETLGRIAAGAAHDMNNVLGVILGYVDLARMQLRANPDKAEAHLETALLSVARVREITNGMLDVPEQAIEPDLGSLDQAASEAAVLIRAAADPRVDVDLDLGDDVPVAPLEAALLRQLVLSLGLRALTAMPEGGALALRTCLEEHAEPLSVGALTLPAGTYACLVVEDQAPPPSPEDSASGDLRLRLAHELAGRYGGILETEHGAEGNLVRVRLPSSLFVPRREGATEAAASGAPRVDILVVDDEEPVRDVLRGFLEIDGYRVAEAGTGKEAMALLEGEAVGTRLVFLDHLLSDVRGARLAWRLAELPEAPTVVMITGMADPDGMDVLPPGTRVLSKPFLYRELKALLEDELRLSPPTSA